MRNRTGRDDCSARRGAPLAAARLRHGRLDTRFLAILTVLLIAVTWQSFVTQTHIHAATGLAAVTASDGGRHVSRPRPAPDRPINCPICHDAALAGHYLPSAPPIVLTILAVAVWRFVAVPLGPVRVRRRRGRRSRAPPPAAGF